MKNDTQDLTIRNAIVASIKSIFGEDADCTVHPRLNSVVVKYDAFRLRFRAYGTVPAGDPEQLMVPVEIGKGVIDVNMPMAKKLIDLATGKETKWYVVRESGGKFADGFYGFDGNIHGEEQIFAEDSLPYKPDSDGIENILVGTGTKPYPSIVAEQLMKLGM